MDGGAVLMLGLAVCVTVVFATIVVAVKIIEKGRR